MTATNTTQRLIELGLRGMATAYERQRDQPAIQTQAFDVRLGDLLDVEAAERDTRKIERYLKAAKLRCSQAALEDVEYRSDRGLDHSQVMALAEGEWIRRKQNLILTGATGTGKSWLACAFGNQVRIPRSSGHPFHEHLTTDSTVIRPPIPRVSDH
ncbi:hypothetical protein KAM428_42650 [Aquipseudomonas alcaligenes]|uniref:ATP-binding protein n=1 Tax=Aquipseudomonas alcaligenes TaxID=43263 RepID=UPI001C81F875|nr:ATP-binding protein [Pseudomonas alcaligenes]GIZ69180.1 hypothetical protein KAM428_42650 [Pseudomonas alcaligenes]